MFSASASEINNAISHYNPHIIHFCGHAGEEGIVVHDKYKRTEMLIKANVLGEVFKSIKEDFPQIEIVLLNACFSQNSAIAISQNNLYTIGTSNEINSALAIPFAEGFYAQYANSKDVRQSVKHGIREVLLGMQTDIKDLVHLYHNGEMLSI